MTDVVSARSIQAWLGISYVLLALIAVARSATVVTAAIALAMMLGAYLTGRTIPDIQVSQSEILRVCGMGLLVIAVGIVVDIVGGSHALEWASVVMAYCAGNRLRAAGIGPAA
jgi:FtsH-binding integral membrane protein